MNIQDTFDKHLQINKYKLTLNLGDCHLASTPLGSGANGVVYTARLHDTEVAIKFFLSDADQEKKTFPEEFKRRFLRIALLETRQNIVQYADFDAIRVQDTYVPVVVMKLYKGSLETLRTLPSSVSFIKLFRFLTQTIQFLHSRGVVHGAIKPSNILIDDHNEFILTDIALTAHSLSTGTVDADITAIGEVLLWYVFGSVQAATPVSNVYKELKAYDTIIRRCLSVRPEERFRSVEEICTHLEQLQGHTPEELLEAFTLICRKNFPKELPAFVHCADQKKIGKLLGDLVAKKDFFGNNLVYFTDVERKVFSPQISKNGYYKFDSSAEFKIIDLWIHSDKERKEDYILIHHAHTLPEKVNGKDTYKWAIYDNKTLITWAEAMNGFAEFEGDIVALDPGKIEFFDRMPIEGYVFICLNYHHHLTHPANNGTLRDYFFRFSFNYVNRYILEDMNHTMRQHVKAASVR